MKIFLFPGQDEPILNIFSFFGVGKVKCENLQFYGSRRANFEHFQFFGVGKVKCENLQFSGSRRANFENFQFFGIGKVKCENLPVPGSRRANFENENLQNYNFFQMLTVRSSN